MPLGPLLTPHPSSGSVVHGAASGTFGFSGSCTGRTVTLTRGAASGEFGFSGTVTGTTGIPTPRPGRFGFEGSASGRVRDAVVTGAASGTFGFPTSRTRGHVGPALPATDWTWGTPEPDPELLRTLRVRLATKDGEYTTIDPAELTDLRIALSRKGGVESIEVTLSRDSRRDYGDLDYWTRCEVEYLGRVWPAFIREAGLEHGRSAMTRPVRMLGHIAKLSERHKGFRKVYVDSRVSAWRTDQGPQTRSYGFETSATGGGGPSD